MLRRLFAVCLGIGLLSVILAAVSCTRDISVDTVRSYTFVYPVSGGRSVEVVVRAWVDLDEVALDLIALGVDRGYERFSRCYPPYPERGSQVVIYVVGHLAYNLYGKYTVSSDVISLDMGYIDRKDHETLEHEIADHRLPFLAGDRNWPKYGHGLSSVCNG